MKAKGDTDFTVYFLSICTRLCKCVHVSVGAHSGQLELQAVVNCLAWGLGIKLGASGRAASALNC